jgi:tryptophan-rich sensory protein
MVKKVDEWFAVIRHFAVFGLGVVIMLNAIWHPMIHRLAELILGAVMIGILPLDSLLKALVRRDTVPIKAKGGSSD